MFGSLSLQSLKSHSAACTFCLVIKAQDIAQAVRIKVHKDDLGFLYALVQDRTILVFVVVLIQILMNLVSGASLFFVLFVVLFVVVVIFVAVITIVAVVRVGGALRRMMMMLSTAQKWRHNG